MVGYPLSSKLKLKKNMPKKIMQDVVVTKKARVAPPPSEAPIREKPPQPQPHIGASLEDHKERQINEPIAKLTREERKKETALEQSPIFERMKQTHKERESFSEEYTSDRKIGIKKIYKNIAIGIGAVLVAGIFIYGAVTYSAFVKISLKHIEVPLTTTKEFVAASDTPKMIPFQIMTITDEQYIGLTATGEKTVNSKASGTITIYNEFGSQSQILIKNTRFQATDGKIYRIDRSVTVPGTKTVGGKTVPGTLDVTVYADASGPSYNIGLSDFTVPGFKGSPRFDKFYAKSKTPMTGGVSGIVKVVSDEDITQARSSLSASLKEKLLKEAEAELPKGMVLFPDAIFYTFTDVLDSSAKPEETNVKFTLKGTLEAVIFDSIALGREVVSIGSPVQDEEKVEIQNIKDLVFAWKKPGSAAPKSTDEISFTLTGSAKAVWVVDTELLKGKLVGIKKVDFQKSLRGFTGIEKSTASIRPFWKTSFPKNLDKIHIETIID